jgi:uncharacterized protein involved in exopolysaccharide biosynthesis
VISFHINSGLATALVIGIPSVTIAAYSYWLSLRAKREAALTQRSTVDAAAYERAKDLYESAIRELRNQVKDLHDGIARIRAELADTRQTLSAQIETLTQANRDLLERLNRKR